MGRFDSVPTWFGNMLPSLRTVRVLSASFTDQDPNVAVVPCTAAAFSSGHAIVGFEFGTIRTNDDLSERAAGIEDQHTRRIGAPYLVLAAVGSGIVGRDQNPGSDDLVLERFLLGGGSSGPKYRT